MTTDNQIEKLQQLSFHLRTIQKVEFPSEALFELLPADDHVMLICVTGSGKLYTDDEVLWISPRSSFLFPPNKAFQVKSRTDMTCYVLRFVVMDITGNAPVFVQKVLFTNKSEFKIYPAQQLLHMTEHIYEAGANHLNTARLQRNSEFIKLIAFIIHQQLMLDGDAGLISVVENSIHYLQEHYREKITVSELESLSQLPNGQYSAIFRELTGKKPLDYLTDLRIKHSEQLLLETKQSLREIAEQVGFKDEYYFNRKFRQTVGMPPRQFAAAMKQRFSIKDWAGRTVTIPVKPSRIIFYGETMEDIFALGIQPVGGGIFLHDPYFDIATAALLKPDLIIIDRDTEADFQRFSNIAPTLTYNSFDTLEKRLLQLGEWLDRKQEAVAWLKQYNESLAALWEQPSMQAIQGKSASVFVFHRGKSLFVMGNIGLTTMLYYEKGFRCPALIEEMMKEQLAYKEIAPQDVQKYAGDVVFMLRPSSNVSREAMYELLDTQNWQALQQSGKNIYIVDELIWNCNDASTLSKVIEMLPHLLGVS